MRDVSGGLFHRNTLGPIINGPTQLGPEQTYTDMYVLIQHVTQTLRLPASGYSYHKQKLDIQIGHLQLYDRLNVIQTQCDNATSVDVDTGARIYVYIYFLLTLIPLSTWPSR